MRTIGYVYDKTLTDMIRFTNINKSDNYVVLTSDKNEKYIIPADKFSVVYDESGSVSFKTIGSRATIGIMGEWE